MKPSDKFKQPQDTEELEKYENLTKNELKERARTEFKIGEEEWKDKLEIEPMISKETADDIANMDKYFAERLENALSGKTLVRTGKGEERWVQTSKAIAGTLLIRSCASIIQTYANKSMWVSCIKEEDFNMQFEDAFKKISDMILMPHTYVDVNSIRTILKIFKDTFWNLGSILGKTGKNMEAYFRALNNKYDEYDKKPRDRYGD